MKRITWVLFTGIFFLAACDYDVPLVAEHNIPIDHAILGTWEFIPDQTDDDEYQLRILKFSETEYLVHDSEDDGGDLYFRAYAINLGGVSAVQLEFLGDDKKPVKSDGENRYLVASYKILDGMLEIRTLNSELVSAESADAESLRKVFLEHKENPELFNDPGLFRRLQD